jgi:hypothetical protein
MNIEIILSEQLNKCGDEYLDEKDVSAIFKDKDINENIGMVP